MAIVGLAFALAFLLFAVIVLRHQQRIYEADLLFNAESVATTILKSLEQDMMANDTTSINRTLAAIGEQDVLKELRIYNHSGEVRASMTASEVGRVRFIRPESRQCAICHEGGNGGNRTLDMMTYDVDTVDKCLRYVVVPIRNQDRCSTAACHAHPADQEILGFLNMGLCRKRLQASIERSRWQILELSLIFIFAVPFLIMVLIKRYVTWPLRQLVQGTRMVSRGEFNLDLPTHAADEIGELARSFTKMVERIQAFKEELEDWNRELEARVAQKAEKLKIAQQQILQAEKMSSLGRLAAVIAHEINNPISGLVVFINLIRKQLEKEDLQEADREKIQKRLALMESEAKRCGAIVSELLAFSREENKMVSCRLSELIERTVSIMRLRTKDRQVDIEVQVEEGVPDITCDPGKIQQVIMNLIQNGMEAMPDGGQIRIGVRYVADEGQVEITVSDTGIGIPENYLHHIFEPFYSSKDNGQSIGIGLFVVYGVVEQHHGTITVDSREGEGTTFTIRLPA